MNGQRFGVILVDHLHVVRTGLARLVSEHPQLELRGEAATADEALACIRSLSSKKDVVVMVGTGPLGDRDAFWLIRQIRQTFPTVRILASGGDADQTLISRTLFVGADGYADRCTGPEEFVEAIVACASGELVVTGAFRGKFAIIAEGIESQKAGSDLLTDREREVLEVASEGLTARETAQRLGLAERTVTTHLQRIYSKLGVSSRLAAVNAAHQRGLLGSPLRIVS